MGSFLKSNSRFERGSRQSSLPIDRFSDDFSNSILIEEKSALSESPDSHWWVNSGAWLSAALGIASTPSGNLDEINPWRVRYMRNNPRDTDDGLHPQNIFRLVETNIWNNFRQAMYFKINALNQSLSPNRNASNGLFLFNRYQTGDNLYYTGLRVDGAAVIKKKINGKYFTLAYKSVFSGAPYDRQINPILLPKNTWLGLRSEVVTNPDQSVIIRFYVDIGKTGSWKLVLEAVDDGKQFGGAPLLSAGYTGIRTDFMDVEFSDYKIEAI